MTTEIQNRIVLVTGANRGIGRAIVDAFVEAGAARVYAAMRKPTQAWHPAITPIALDLSDPASIEHAAAQLRDVDILVNNAGVASGRSLLGADDLAGAEHEMRVNYFGTLRMCRAFAPVLASNGGGAIVNVLSILSRVNAPAAGSYSASKAAALSLTQGVRAELAGQSTLVVGVMPAFVDTDMTRGVALPKMTANDVALAIVDAVRSGTEDVYPGEVARSVAAQLQADPKAVERHFAAMRAGE